MPKILKEKLKDKTLLYLEDDEMLYRNFIEMFKMFFKEVHHVENGKEAIDILNNNDIRIDIIITDYNMPIMDGESFLKHLRQCTKNSHIPAILFSANPDTNHVNHLLDAKMGKPLSMEKFKSTILDLCEKKLKDI